MWGVGGSFFRTKPPVFAQKMCKEWLLLWSSGTARAKPVDNSLLNFYSCTIPVSYCNGLVFAYGAWAWRLHTKINKDNSGAFGMVLALRCFEMNPCTWHKFCYKAIPVPVSSSVLRGGLRYFEFGTPFAGNWITETRKKDRQKPGSAVFRFRAFIPWKYLWAFRVSQRALVVKRRPEGSQGAAMGKNMPLDWGVAQGRKIGRERMGRL